MVFTKAVLCNFLLMFALLVEVFPCLLSHCESSTYVHIFNIATFFQGTKMCSSQRICEYWFCTFSRAVFKIKFSSNHSHHGTRVKAMSGMLHKADIGCNLKSFLPSSQGRPKIPGTPWLFSRVGSVFPVNYAGKCPPHRCFATLTRAPSAHILNITLVIRAYVGHYSEELSWNILT